MAQQIEPITIPFKKNWGEYLFVFQSYPFTASNQVMAEILDKDGNLLYSIMLTSNSYEDVAQQLGLTLIKEPKQESQGYICPQTQVKCDDECCVSAEDCHIKSSIGVLSDENNITQTLEEAAEINCESITHPYCDREKAMFVKGAKWQQEHGQEVGHSVQVEETLEEGAEKHLQKWRLLNNIHLSNILHAERFKNDFIAGGNWQEKSMYSEEQVIELIQFLSMSKYFNGYGSVSKETAKYFLEKFKK